MCLGASKSAARLGRKSKQWRLKYSTADESVITHFKYDRHGAFLARYPCDRSGKYWPCTPVHPPPAMAKLMEEAKLTPGKVYACPGGAWGGAEGESPRPPDASALAADAANFVVPFQREAGYCVFGSLLNAVCLTAKQRVAIEDHMTEYSDLKALRATLNTIGCGVQLAGPPKWYPHFDTDPSLSFLLEWFLSGDATGEFLVNVEEFDGSRSHYLLFDCARNLVMDVSPKHGRRALPLTKSTMKAMQVMAVARAAMVLNLRIPKRFA